MGKAKREKPLVRMTPEYLDVAFLGLSFMPALMEDARLKLRSINVAALVLESPEVGARLVVTDLEYGDRAGIESVLDAKRECLRLNLLKPGEELHVRLYRFEGGRGIEITEEG